MSTRVDYKNGAKNNWRNFVWNRIVERLPCAPRTAITLYLAAASDLDRLVAIRHGFSPDNLIAIERDRTVLKTLRQQTRLVVDADAVDCLLAWPCERKVDVIALDFCCGLELPLIEALVPALLNPAFANAVICLNFQRGRDQSTNLFRENFATFGPYLEMAREFGVDARLHRGWHFWVFHLTSVSLAMRRTAPDISCVRDTLFRCFMEPVTTRNAAVRKIMEQRVRERADRQVFECLELDDPTGALGSLLAGAWRISARVRFSTYAAVKPLKFDSVVFRNIGPVYPNRTMFERVIERELRGNDRRTTTRRRIAAILAHRTMRFAAQ